MMIQFEKIVHGNDNPPEPPYTRTDALVVAFWILGVLAVVLLAITAFIGCLFFSLS